MANKILNVWRNTEGEYYIAEHTIGEYDDVVIAFNLSEDQLYSMLKLLPDSMVVHIDRTIPKRNKVYKLKES